MVWAQGPMGPKWPKPTALMTFPTIKNVKTQRLAKSFEDLNSSLAQSTGELWTCCKVVQK